MLSAFRGVVSEQRQTFWSSSDAIINLTICEPVLYAHTAVPARTPTMFIPLPRSAAHWRAAATAISPGAFQYSKKIQHLALA